MPRPRDDDAEQRVLAVTVELVAAHGFADFTVARAAERAGVGRPLVYRRWPDAASLAADAVVRTARPPRTAPLDLDVAGLVRLVTAAVVELSSSAPGRAATDLLSHAGLPDEVRRRLMDEYFVPRRAAVRDAVERVRANGGLRPDLDPDAAVDALVGPSVYRWLTTGVPARRAATERAVRLVLDGLTPR